MLSEDDLMSVLPRGRHGLCQPSRLGSTLQPRATRTVFQLVRSNCRCRLLPEVKHMYNAFVTQFSTHAGFVFRPRLSLNGVIVSWITYNRVVGEDRSPSANG